MFSTVKTGYDCIPGSNNMIDVALGIMALNAGKVYITLSDESTGPDQPIAKIPEKPLDNAIPAPNKEPAAVADEDKKLRTLIRDEVAKVPELPPMEDPV